MNLNVPTIRNPPPSTSSGGGATGNPRNKISLKRGRSLMDWVRISSATDLTSVGGLKTPVTASELKKHNTADDAWMCIRGQVYNVTPYMEYHPGGIPELLKGAGIDATDLFDDIHNWVNYRSMLARCLVGPFVSETVGKKGKPAGVLSPINMLPPPTLPAIKPDSKPKFDWLQTETNVSLVFYTHWKQIVKEKVVIETLEDKKIQIILRLKEHIYKAAVVYDGDYVNELTILVGNLSGKITIGMQKAKPGERWASVKLDDSQPIVYEKTSNFERIYRLCTVTTKTEITHDTKLFCITLPENVRMSVPIGHHIHIEEQIMLLKMSCPYTVVTESLLSTSDAQTHGRCLYLMIKLYDDGALTPTIHKLQTNDPVHISIIPEGDFDHHIFLNNTEHLTLFAAGTGFTPMIRLIQYVLVEAQLECDVTLVFFNKDEPDILWKEQLDNAVAKYNNFSVVYVLSKAQSSWHGLRGRLSKELVETYVTRSKADNSCVFCCGPSAFSNECVRLVKDCGYSDDNIHMFT